MGSPSSRFCFGIWKTITRVVLWGDWKIKKIVINQILPIFWVSGWLRIRFTMSDSSISSLNQLTAWRTAKNSKFRYAFDCRKAKIIIENALVKFISADWIIWYLVMSYVNIGPRNSAMIQFEIVDPEEIICFTNVVVFVSAEASETAFR